MDVGMEPDTEFGPTAVENLLSVAAVVYRDLEEAGFTSEEVHAIAEHVIAFAKAAKGGRN